MRVATYLIVIAFALFESVLAYPSGAGSCNAGNNAVGSTHKTGTITTGSLATGGFTVKLSGVALSTSTTRTFYVNTASTLTLSGPSFKGFLLRLGEVGSVQTDNALTGSGTVKVSPLCTSAGVGGVTHTSNTVKSSVSATLKVTSAASSLPLDVTVVVRNSAGISTYYYSQFKISAVTKTPTRRPTRRPTKRPTVKV